MKELNNFRKFLTEEEADKQIHEGTWSLGSAQNMEAALTQLQGMMREDNPAAWMQAFEDLDSILYRVFGDDGFHDALGASKAAVEAGDIDRAKNELSDAIGIAQKLLAFQVKQNAGNLEENDGVLDEIIGEEKEEVTEATIFDRIDQMIDTIADQMSPDDAFKALAAEFQVVSGGTMMLERALRRMVEDLGLTGDVREEEVEEIRSAYNEEKEEK